MALGGVQMARRRYSDKYKREAVAKYETLMVAAMAKQKTRD